MDQQKQIIEWLAADSERMRALETAAALGLHDWCLAAGFVRNLVWDRLHGDDMNTPLNDIDLIYFDRALASSQADELLERKLAARSTFPWSVKNQARMHARNNDSPYSNTQDAMRNWPEIETAIGVALDKDGRIDLVAPFGLEQLFKLTVTINSNRPNNMVFLDRLISKRWTAHWPKLRVNFV